MWQVLLGVLFVFQRGLFRCTEAFGKFVSVFALGGRRERQQKRCDLAQWGWVFNTSMSWIPPSLHAFKDVARVPGHSWAQNLDKATSLCLPSAAGSFFLSISSFPIKPPITRVFKSLLTLVAKPRHGMVLGERWFLSLVAFETRLENGVCWEEMTMQRQHPWRSWQDFLMLQRDLVLDYLVTSELRLLGNDRRVWLGFMRTLDSVCADEKCWLLLVIAF